MASAGSAEGSMDKEYGDFKLEDSILGLVVGIGTATG
jgi:hypothetical protein